MARITVEDCLEHVENRFELVMVSSKRARQLQTGGKEAMVPEDNDKPTVLALREIAAGLIDASILIDTPEVEEAIDSITSLDANTATASGKDDISIEAAMAAALAPEEPSAPASTPAEEEANQGK